MTVQALVAQQIPTGTVTRLMPGVLICAALAASALQLGGIPWFATHGLSGMTVAIVLGTLIGNSFYPRIAWHAGHGVAFSKQSLLRAGVVLYGLRLTLGDVSKVGFAGIAVDAVMLSSTFALAIILGTRLFRLDRDTSVLIGAGSAVCGAAAVMAVEPVLKAKAERVTVAVATVVVFGTVATFLYPILYGWNQQLGIVPAGQWAFGIYAGSTIHEVAQVVAAARSIGPDAANAAVIAKMVRVMMLAPLLIGLSLWLNRRHGQATEQGTRKLVLPLFALGFVGVVIFNTLSILPQNVVDAAISLDTFLLAMAMSALGLTTHFSAIRNAGARPLILAALLLVWLVVGGALVNHFVPLGN
ncbi:MAG TPA: YeiH family protein [Rudaea sp.]|nr:YeiH family protein [Rudaea sp.]